MDVKDDSLNLAVDHLEKTVSQYQSELDTKVNFGALQDAIDALEKAMQRYQGFAQEKMDHVRRLNTKIRHDYRKCVSLIFEWCTTATNIIATVLTQIGSKSKDTRKMNIKMVHELLKDGLEKAEASLSLLDDVLLNTSELKDQFLSLTHVIEKNYNKKLAETTPWWSNLISGIFSEVGEIIFSFIGKKLGFSEEMAKIFGAKCLEEWNNVMDPKKKIEGIKTFFEILKDRVEVAQKTTSNVIDALKEDHTNLAELKGKLRSSDIVSRGYHIVLICSPKFI